MISSAEPKNIQKPPWDLKRVWKLVYYVVHFLISALYNAGITMPCQLASHVPPAFLQAHALLAGNGPRLPPGFPVAVPSGSNTLGGELRAYS